MRPFGRPLAMRIAIIVVLCITGMRISMGGPLYIITELGTLGGSSSYGVGVNDSGQVAGNSSTTAQTITSHPFLTDPNGGAMHDLGSGGFAQETGITCSGVNNNGEVTGTVYTSIFTGEGDASYAFISAANGGTLSEIFYGSGAGINAGGQVVGESNGYYMVFLSTDFYTDGCLTSAHGGNPVTYINSFYPKLGSDPTGYCSGFGVNSRGQITGESDSNSFTGDHAILSAANGGALIDLGTLPGGSTCRGNSVNDSGQVAGFSDLDTTGTGNIHAFVSGVNGGALQDLGTLAGDTNSSCNSINNSGQIVGVSGTSRNIYTNSANNGGHAFIYSNGQMQSLASVITGSNPFISLENATCISNTGYITGYGIDASGNERAFLATPVTTQSISAFAMISPVTYGVTPFSITLPTASSRLPVAVTVQSGPATISGNTLTITGAGTVVLAADQSGGASGNTHYLAAAEVTTSFTVNPAPLTVAVNAGGASAYGSVPTDPGLSVTSGTLFNNDTLISLGLTDSFNLTSSSAPGLYPISVVGAQNVANYTVTTAGATYAIEQASVITSANAVTFSGDTTTSFTVTTTGYPNATITEAEALPSGVTFTDNHDGTATLSGLPALGSEGNYSITIKAGNGLGTAASQTFILTVLAATGYDGWVEGEFSPTQIAQTNFTGVGDTPFGDGVPNLHKYAFAINPSAPMNSAARGFLPKLGMSADGTKLTLTFHEAKNLLGVTVTVQTSSSLQSGSWTQVTNVASAVDPNSGSDMIVTAQVPISGNGAPQFFRVQVTSQ